MTRRSRIAWAVLGLALAGALAGVVGCGQKGDLYLPEQKSAQTR